MTQLLENVFRNVNVALVDQVAQLCARMGLDIWEVVEAGWLCASRLRSRLTAGWRQMRP